MRYFAQDGDRRVERFLRQQPLRGALEGSDRFA
jgi:hypothetical protein